MSWYPWTSTEAVPPTIGGDKETGTGDKEEDHQPEETCLHQGMKTPPKHSALTMGKKDTMNGTALKRDSSPITRGITGKQTSSTYKKKENRTTKCKRPKNWTLWHQSVLSWDPCPSKTRCI